METGFHSYCKNKIIWFRGDRVKLTGEWEFVHGGRFFIGYYMEGHKKGHEVSIAETLI